MNLGPCLNNVQVRLLSVFGENNKNLNVWMIFMFLIARATSLLATIQKKDYEMAQIQIIQIFAWVSAIANHQQVNVDLAKNLRLHFPGLCPSCGEAICDCQNGRPSERLSKDDLNKYEERLPNVNLQCMLSNIFPGNTLIDSVNHLLAEIGELGQEIVQASLADREHPHYGLREGFCLELADVTAHTCAVASLLEMNLADVSLRYFENGCPVCENQFCQCPVREIELKKVGTKVLPK